MLRPIACLLALMASGCWSHERYAIDGAVLRKAAALDEGQRSSAALPARRLSDGRVVHLRARAIRFAGLDLAAPSSTVQVDAKNTRVTVAVVLTAIGSVLSVVGTASAFFTKGTAQAAAVTVELFGEPPMLIGTVLWPLGLVRMPEEVQPGSAGVLFVE